MAQAIKGMARLRVLAGAAQPSPAIGQALGPLGVNMVEFCKQFNDRTTKWNKDRKIPVPVNVVAFEDRTFDFSIKTPPTSWFIKQAAGIGKGSPEPGKESAGTIDVRAVYEIAKIKQRDDHLEMIPLKSLAASVVGTAKSMGIQVTA